MLSDASAGNPFSQPILDNIPAQKACVALGWRHFMYWFADAEFRLSAGSVSAQDLVAAADATWGAVENSKPKIFMEEPPEQRRLGEAVEACFGRVSLF